MAGPKLFLSQMLLNEIYKDFKISPSMRYSHMMEGGIYSFMSAALVRFSFRFSASCVGLFRFLDILKGPSFVLAAVHNSFQFQHSMALGGKDAMNPEIHVMSHYY